LSLAAAVAALTLAGCSSGPSATPSGGAAPTQPKAGTASNPVGDSRTNSLAAVPKSTFHIEPQFGRDPFFPGASRSPKAAAAPATRLPTVSYLKLVGIRPGTKRPMALINRTALALGEEGDVAIVVPNQQSTPEVQKISIRCLEIRPDSVLISIAGEEGVKELRLAQAK
jgi:hypothetical protein